MSLLLTRMTRALRRTRPRSRRGLRLGLLAVLAAAPPAGAVEPGTTLILSGTPSLTSALPNPVAPSLANSESVSADGRYVAFTSLADGLSAEDDDEAGQVFVKDRQTGAVVLVSRRSGPAGAPATGEGCGGARISADAARVVFVCSGPLDDADTDGRYDLYVRDLTGPRTTRLLTGDVVGDLRDFSVDGDGNAVAVEVPDDLDPADNNNHPDVYLRDVDAGTWRLVSRRNAATPAGTLGAGRPSISDDAKRVAYVSRSGDLLGASTDFGGKRHVLLARVEPSSISTSLVDRATGAQGATGDADADRPAISGDGGRIAFESAAGNLVGGDTTDSDVFVRAITAGTTLQVSNEVDAVGFGPAIDADGSHVAFLRQLDGRWNLVLRDTGSPASGQTIRAAVDDDDVNALAGGIPAVDGTAAVVIAQAKAPVVADADPRQMTVVAHDPVTGAASLVSRPSGAAPFRNAGGDSRILGVSADGSHALLVGERLGIVGDGVIAAVRNLRTGGLLLAGRGDGPDGAADPSVVTAALSADGRRVAWTTRTRVLPTEDADDELDVYVRDLDTARTTLASVRDDGLPIVAEVRDPSLDADGSRVAFTANGAGHAPGDDRAEAGVLVRDLPNRRTILAGSRDGATPDEPDLGSGHGRLSGDGTKVVFESRDPAVVASVGGGPLVYLRDLAAGTTVRVGGDDEGREPQISADGTRVLVLRTAGTQRLVLHDLVRGTADVVSRANGPGGAETTLGPLRGVLSGDGGHVAFQTRQPLGLPGDVLSRPRWLVRDVAAATTDLALTTPAGGVPRASSEDAALSADGACIAVAQIGQSPLSPSAGVSFEIQETYLRARRPGCVPAPGGVSGTGGGVSGAGGGGGAGTQGGGATSNAAPVLSDLRLSVRTFRPSSRPTALSAAARRLPFGTTIRYRLSEAATVGLAVERATVGRRVGRTCRKATRVLTRRPRCTRYVAVGALRRRATAGTNRVPFSGRLGRRALRPGSYRLAAQATDALGARSQRPTLTFTVR